MSRPPLHLPPRPTRIHRFRSAFLLAVVIAVGLTGALTAAQPAANAKVATAAPAEVPAIDPYQLELVADIAPGGDSYPLDYVQLDDTVYFTANGSGSTGSADFDLWRSDGTEAGTEFVASITTSKGEPAYPTQLRAAGGDLYFIAKPDDPFAQTELWRSDGTTGGTQRVTELEPRNLFVAGDELYVDAFDATDGSQLWRTNGNVFGTVLLADVNPGPVNTDSELEDIVLDVAEADGLVYFIGQDRDDDNILMHNALWVTDGTPSGTDQLKLFTDRGAPFGADRLTALGDQVLFTGFDATHGGELWATDGTVAGTRLVRDIDAGADGSNPDELHEVNGHLLFTASDAAHGRELWRTDGTEAGTGLVEDIRPGAESGVDLDTHLVVVDDTAYFRASTGFSPALWASDGTTAGTRLVDLNSHVFPFLVAHGRLLLLNTGALNGYELVVDDETGFRLIADLNPGPADGFVGAGPPMSDGTLFFAGDDGEHGIELWKLSIPPDTEVTGGPADGASMTQDEVEAGDAIYDFTGTDLGGGEIDRLECSLDGAAFTECTSPLTFTGLEVGEHTFEFRAVGPFHSADPTPASRTLNVEASAVDPPSNQFTVKQGKADTRKGTRQVVVKVPGPGRVTLAPKGKKLVKSAAKNATRAGQVKLVVKPTQKAKQSLKKQLKRGKKTAKLKVKVKLRYTPTGGTTRQVVRTFKLKLKKKRR